MYVDSCFLVDFVVILTLSLSTLDYISSYYSRILYAHPFFKFVTAMFFFLMEKTEKFVEDERGCNFSDLPYPTPFCFFFRLNYSHHVYASFIICSCVASLKSSYSLWEDN